MFTLYLPRKYCVRNHSKVMILIAVTFITYISLFLSVHHDDAFYNVNIESGKEMLSFLNNSTRDLTKTNIDDVVVFYEKINTKIPLQQCHLNYICQNKSEGLPKNISNKASSFPEIWQNHKDVITGGSWRPDSCTQESLIALIVPYRDRELHLKVFTKNIIPFLKAQKKAFTIFVVEQIGPQMFNKAQMMNAGFIESQKLGNYTCFIFHDVDMIPVNLCNLYECPATGMRHLGLSRDLENPHYEYPFCVGGASAFPKDVFTRINGFTNVMFGWGGEDDDAYMRLRKERIPIHRYPAVIGNYFNLLHNGSGMTNPYSQRAGNLASSHNRYRQFDGLNTVNYTVKSITKELLFTRITVSVPGPINSDGVKWFFAFKTLEFQELKKKDPLYIYI